MKKLRIFIDPGHGGHDPGAVGNEMRESDIALDVSLRLETLLVGAGFEVMLSRKADVAISINERHRMANTWGADIFISVHVNAGGGTGVETLIPTASPNNLRRDLQANRRFAEIISNALGKRFKMRVRRANGVMLETETRHGSIGVLRHSSMLAILAELAFIDSPLHNPDINILRNMRQEMAETLVEGILQFLGKDSFALSPVERFPLDPVNVHRLVELGVINTPDFWLRVDQIQWLDELLGNIGKSGMLDRRVNNGVRDVETALHILANAGIMNTPKYWRNQVNSGKVKFLGQLLINMANRCLDPLHRIVWAEARGEDMKGQILVVNVIQNRQRSNMYPDGVWEILTQERQFEPMRNGGFQAATPDKTNREAVQRALSGEDHSQGALFFNATRLRYTSWAGMNRVHAFDHGGHSFYF